MLKLRHPHLVPIFACGRFSKGESSYLDLLFFVCVVFMFHVGDSLFSLVSGDFSSW